MALTTETSIKKEIFDALTELADICSNINEYRNEDKAKEIIKPLSKLLKEDRSLGMAWVIYLRDRKDGLGERAAFRYILKWLASHKEKKYITFKFLKRTVLSFGRWDDIFCLRGTDYEDMMYTLINEGLERDIELVKDGKYPSKLAKWLPSVNSKKKEGREFVNAYCKRMKKSPKQYRKTLSMLRAKIDLIETRLTERNFDKVNYFIYSNETLALHDNLLSKIDKKQYNLFKRHRFMKYKPHDNDPLDLGRYLDRRVKNKYVNTELIKFKYDSTFIKPNDAFGNPVRVPRINFVCDDNSSKYLRKIIYAHTKTINTGNKLDRELKWNTDRHIKFPYVRHLAKQDLLVGYNRHMLNEEFLNCKSEYYLNTAFLLYRTLIINKNTLPQYQY